MAVPDWASAYIGLPFREHGRDRDGVDCYGLVRLIYQECFGLALPSYGATYAAADDGDSVARTLRDNLVDAPAWDEVADGAERLGDAVHMIGWYRVDGRLRRGAMHVGMVLCPRQDGGTLIHCELGQGTSLARYRRIGMQHRIIAFYRNRSLNG